MLRTTDCTASGRPRRVAVIAAISVGVLAGASTTAVAESDVVQRPDLVREFSRERTAGTMVVRQSGRIDRTVIVGDRRSRRRFLPSSTFKIPNAGRPQRHRRSRVVRRLRGRDAGARRVRGRATGGALPSVGPHPLARGHERRGGADHGTRSSLRCARHLLATTAVLRRRRGQLPAGDRSRAARHDRARRDGPAPRRRPRRRAPSPGTNLKPIDLVAVK